MNARASSWTAWVRAEEQRLVPHRSVTASRVASTRGLCGYSPPTVSRSLTMDLCADCIWLTVRCTVKRARSTHCWDDVGRYERLRGERVSGNLEIEEHSLSRELPDGCCWKMTGLCRNTVGWLWSVEDCSPMECRKDSATAAVNEVGLLIHALTDDTNSILNQKR